MRRYIWRIGRRNGVSRAKWARCSVSSGGDRATGCLESESHTICVWRTIATSPSGNISPASTVLAYNCFFRQTLCSRIHALTSTPISSVSRRSSIVNGSTIAPHFQKDKLSDTMPSPAPGSLAPCKLIQPIYPRYIIPTAQYPCLAHPSNPFITSLRTVQGFQHNVDGK